MHTDILLNCFLYIILFKQYAFIYTNTLYIVNIAYVWKESL